MALYEDTIGRGRDFLKIITQLIFYFFGGFYEQIIKITTNFQQGGIIIFESFGQTSL